MAEACYHCGLSIRGTARFYTRLEGIDRPMCCPGCKMVAETICAGGLQRYYQYRTEPGLRTDEREERLAEYALYDREDIQSDFTSSLADGCRESALLIKGITCSACVWLIQHHLSRHAGISQVSVNLSQHSCTVRWQSQTTCLSAIMAAILEIGYEPLPFRSEQQTALMASENRQFLGRLAVAGIGAMQVMMYAIALYAGALQSMEPQYRILLRWVSALVATPVVLYSARPFFRAALRDVRNRKPGMDVPVALAIGSAWLASLWATLRGEGEVYFDSVSMFTFFLLAGRYLEMRARHRAGRIQHNLNQLLPESCLRLCPCAPPERVCPSDLKCGDSIRVYAGNSIAADGLITSGQTCVNEAALTGEFFPVSRGQGETVVAGTVNCENTIDVKVTRVGHSTRLGAITRLLQQAQTVKPATARLTDTIASLFVCVILLVAAAVWCWWWFRQPEDALWITLSVLVATCPCALSLATPTALTVATSTLQRAGVLVSRSHLFEALPGITHVLFDKTGTLTTDELRLRTVHRIDERFGKKELLAIAAALEAHSNHPAANAFPASQREVSSVRTVAGSGVEGVLNGQTWRIGKPSFVSFGEVAAPPDPLQTSILLGCNNTPMAWFCLDDTVRPEAAAVIEQLKNRGLAIEMLSGDGPGAVSRVADTLGIPTWRSAATSQDKFEHLRHLQRNGARVLMVGDGINDVPVLAAADLSVAMNGAIEQASTQADATLLTGRLQRLLTAFDIARSTRRVIRQNTLWALFYNALALPLAACGWLAPWMAAIGMSTSSLIVVGNALRLANRHQSAHVPADQSLPFQGGNR